MVIPAKSRIRLHAILLFLIVVGGPESVMAECDCVAQGVGIAGQAQAVRAILAPPEG